MEILHEINPALEALAYLGSRANGHTLDRLEERLQARGVRKAEPFHRASAALRELLQDLDTEVSVPAETLQRLFGDIKGFPTAPSDPIVRLFCSSIPCCPAGRTLRP